MSWDEPYRDEWRRAEARRLWRTLGVGLLLGAAVAFLRVIV